MYNIILLIIALCLVIAFFYIFYKDYKKSQKKKEGFMIGDNNNLATSAITDMATYKDNLGSIVNELKAKINFEAKREDIIDILELQSQVIRLSLVYNFLNFNLNYSPDYLMALNQQALFSLNSHDQTGPELAIQDVVNPSGNTKTSDGGGFMTSLLGLNSL